MAYDDGYYYGLAKVIVLASADSDNGKTVTVTNGTQTYTGTMADSKCAFKIPGNDVYTVRIGANSCDVDISYGECAEVYVPDGKKDVAETKAKFTTDIANTKTELQTNFQAGVDSVYNAIVAQGTTPASKSLSDVVAGIASLSANRDKKQVYFIRVGNGSGSTGNVTVTKPGTAYYVIVASCYRGQEGVNANATVFKNGVQVDTVHNEGDQTSKYGSFEVSAGDVVSGSLTGSHNYGTVFVACPS